MFQQMQKKLILVGNKETDVYCEYLSMLVSTCDDHNDGEKQIVVGVPDGTVDTAIWTNEIYRDNRAHTSSRQKFLFIGDDGAVKNVIPNIDFFEDESEDKQCGIFYGWLGNKAVIYINESAVKDERIYDRIFPQFRKLGEEYNRKISEATVGAEQDENTLKRPQGLSVRGLGKISVPFLAYFGIPQALDKKALERTRIDQAYRYAVLKFYLYYLNQFLE